MTRTVLRWLLAAVYLVAGWFHLSAPGPFLSITPGWVPAPDQVIYWTGMAEVAGALAQVQPFGPHLRKAAGWGLAAYALCVWPANFNHMLMDLAKPDSGLGLAYHLPPWPRSRWLSGQHCGPAKSPIGLSVSPLDRPRPSS